MPLNKFLAIDIGAESGRVIVGILENEKFSDRVHGMLLEQAILKVPITEHVKILDHFMDRNKCLSQNFLQ